MSTVTLDIQKYHEDIDAAKRFGITKSRWDLLTALATLSGGNAKLIVIYLCDDEVSQVDKDMILKIISAMGRLIEMDNALMALTIPDDKKPTGGSHGQIR